MQKVPKVKGPGKRKGKGQEKNFEKSKTGSPKKSPNFTLWLMCMHQIIGNPGSPCVTRDIIISKYREQYNV